MNRKIAKGKRCYAQQQGPVKAEGLAFTEPEMKAALSNQVRSILFDDVGRTDIAQALTEVASTEFQVEQLRGILDQPPDLKNWQVGEALAEAWLTDHRACNFPWPSSRDLRNRNASPAGADLVGFQLQNGSCRLAFGEVKTSREALYPPQVVTKRGGGLVEQLETLRDDPNTKDDLFKYLAKHARQAAWNSRFQQAAVRYLQNKADIALFGVLVRDVKPEAKDLEGRISKMAKGCPKETSVELLAFYLPLGMISTLAQQVYQSRSPRR